MCHAAMAAAWQPALSCIESCLRKLLSSRSRVCARRACDLFWRRGAAPRAMVSSARASAHEGRPPAYSMLAASPSVRSRSSAHHRHRPWPKRRRQYQSPSRERFRRAVATRLREADRRLARPLSTSSAPRARAAAFFPTGLPRGTTVGTTTEWSSDPASSRDAKSNKRGLRDGTDPKERGPSLRPPNHLHSQVVKGAQSILALAFLS